MPKFELNIPENPITHVPFLERMNEALETCRSESLDNFNWYLFSGGARIRQIRAKFIIRLLKMMEPECTMELGSGATTQIFGTLVGRKHRSLEHLKKYWTRTTGSLKELGIEKGKVLLRPLDNGGMYQLEDGDIEQGSIRILLIDGPPYRPLINGVPKWNRVHTLPALLEYLADDAIVLLDSTERPFEQNCLVNWAEDYGVQYENPRMLGGLGIIDPWASSR